MLNWFHSAEKLPTAAFFPHFYCRAEDETKLVRRRAAAEDVMLRGLSFRVAASAHGISVGSLQIAVDTLKAGKPLLPPGRPTRYPEMFEKVLAEQLTELARRGTALSILEVLNFVHASWKKLGAGDGLESPTYAWLQGFIRRHPSLSMRVPKPGSMARHTWFNRLAWKKWFALYLNVVSKFEMEEILNCDDKGFDFYKKKFKVSRLITVPLPRSHPARSSDINMLQLTMPFFARTAGHCAPWRGALARDGGGIERAHQPHGHDGAVG